MREVNTPGNQEDGVWPRPSVCMMAIGDCPVHSFLVVIEMPALQPAHSFEISAGYNLHAATYTCAEERDVGGREATLL